LAILSVLIIVHELGHFSVARLFGFQTPVFGFGLPFGPFWTVGKKWGTEFRIHACLLGGYVAIPELGDESNTSEDAFGVPLKPFRKFPIWQRALVAFAGVGMNIFFAYLVMLAMFLTLGEPSQPTVVHSLPKSNPIAANAGIKVKDEVVAIDDKEVVSPEDAVHYLTSHKATEVKVHVLRDGQKVVIPVTTNADGKVGMALVSQGAMNYHPVHGSFPEIAVLAGQKLWNLTANMLETLGAMFSGLFATHKGAGGEPSLGIQDLHGVLAVVAIGSNIAQQDWSQLFLFTIMISMDLAIINLVPWPGLDGGHLGFMALEAVRGRPMGERAQGEIVKWGFVSLLLLMAVVMVNDITALFSGKLNYSPKSKEKQSAPAEKKTAPEQQPAPSSSSETPTPAPATPEPTAGPPIPDPAQSPAK
jgi:regulator of sigma E protease